MGKIWIFLFGVWVIYNLPRIAIFLWLLLLTLFSYFLAVMGVLIGGFIISIYWIIEKITNILERIRRW